MQREQVLELAGMIEREMNAVGLTGGSSGSFETWMLHAYLPSLRDAASLPEPALVFDKALAVWVKSGPEEDGPTTVLDLLFRLDRALEIGLEVSRFGFFDSAVAAEKGRLASHSGRALVSRFEQRTTRYVTWQLELNHPERRRHPVTLLVDWEYQLEDGSKFGRGTERLTIQPEWTTSWLAKGWGWETPGSWKRGTHRATLRLWRRTLAESTFVIE